jgi:DNA-binding MarR family transcriptional regulator
MKNDDAYREVYDLIRDLTKSLRFFQSESIFCEGVTFTQYSILDFVSKNENTGMTRLGDFLDVEKSTTTRLVKPLIDHRYLDQVKSKDDLRTTHLQITPSGDEIRQRVEKCMFGFIDVMTKKINPEEKIATIQSVKKFSTLLSGCCRGGCQTKKIIKRKNI